MISRFFAPGTGLGPASNDPLGMFRREVDRAFDEVVRGFPALGQGMTGGFAPSLDVRETEQGLELAAELPGMSEKDVDLRLDGDLLILSGEKKDERTQEQGGLHLTERNFGRFQRAFRLPFRPEQGQVQARFDKGILHITLPRPTQLQAGGRIQIQGGSDAQPPPLAANTPGSAGESGKPSAGGKAA